VGNQGRIIPVRLDVARAPDTIDTIRVLDGQCGGFDLIVANAGMGPETPGYALDWEMVRRIFDVTAIGAAATLAAVADRMADRGRGHLVAVASLAGLRGLPRNAAYSGAKALVATFVESLRLDLRHKGVKVSLIQPGFVRTPGTAHNAFKMPFLMECDEAVERIGRAILRGDSEYGFPLPTAAAMRLAKWLPNAWYDALTRTGDGMMSPPSQKRLRNWFL
jgi:short-subunit dehydrogenase